MRRFLPSLEDAVEWFAAANIGFLGVDIFFAHSVNQFAHRAEWAPIVFSTAATPLLMLGMAGARMRARMRSVTIAVGAAAVVVGAVGMIFHLKSAFFESQTLHSLVYSAPFVAPLAYVGVGLLILLSQLEKPGSLEWARWVVLLALGGLAGNVGLSLLDHAQNGFFRPVEWLSVIAAAFGVGFVAVAVVRPEPAILKACGVVLAAQVVVGLFGFALHVRADLFRPGRGLFEQAVYGAPVFAPLLFVNLALLAALGLESLRRARANGV